MIIEYWTRDSRLDSEPGPALARRPAAPGGQLSAEQTAGAGSAAGHPGINFSRSVFPEKD
jgi:hypothetical protein